MVIGGLGVWLRAIPLQAWEWFVEQTTMMITVKDDDAAFGWVKEWFLEQRFVRRMRRIDLDTTLRTERVALIPAKAFTGSAMKAGRFKYGFRAARTRASERRVASNP
jgi:BCS1 N terminal